MTLIYVLRHPQTTWNVEKRYQGRLESPVSDEGRIEAKAASLSFEGIELEAIYSSPLKRAAYLAEKIARVTDAPIIVDERLTEMAQCPWEGLYLHEIQQQYPELYQRWYSRPDLVRFPGGESIEDIAERALPVLADIYARYPNGQVAVTTHSVVIQTLVATAIRLDYRFLHRLRIDNATITSLGGSETPGQLLALNANAPYRAPRAATEKNTEWAVERRAS